MNDLEQLNREFGIEGVVRFEAGPGELTVARVTNPLAEAVVALHGAHVLSYRPAASEDVLWVSKESVFRDGEPIRGGIPVCWPWFGMHPDNPQLPAHGFVRRRAWTFLGAETLAADGATRLRLALKDDAATQAIWPHRFRLELHVTVGRELTVSLLMHNRGAAAYTCTAALHTYFNIGAIGGVTVKGLAGCTYIDTVGGQHRRQVQKGDIAFDREVDRVYVDTTATCTIEAPAMKRRIEVAKQGSHTTVVWNPWIAKAQRMPDFGNDEYLEMVCVETANAAADAVTILPAASHATTAIVRALSL